MSVRRRSRRAGEAERGSADSDATRAGSGRNGSRISIRTRIGTHTSLTSSQSQNVQFTTRLARKQEYRTRSISGNRTPLVRVSALHAVSGPTTKCKAGSHLGSTLKPGGAVLTLGVSRRSGSVACIRVDASPNEVLTPTMMHEHPAEVNSPRPENRTRLTSRYESVTRPARPHPGTIPS
jgi:hypothetical protein